ncbi:MAG: 5-phospho-D-xylono,4-lactonase [Clostridiales bacterium]|nr:5-phospho-D-xylono,4-lactonase [Clostridiales bacterium]
MNKVQTVLGTINGEELGFCHCHEHLFIADGQSAVINPVLRIDDFGKTTQELEAFRNSGGRSLVDAQPIGCGRMTAKLVMTSKMSGINIVASTGFHKLIFYPEGHWIYEMDESKLASIFIDELQNGMFLNSEYDNPSTQISSKAGIIKTALDEEGLTERYKKLFRAAAYASINTGVPLLCHTEMGKHALELIEFLTKQGVKESAIILCHLDRTADNPEYHKEVAQTGVYLEYDTIGRYKYHSDEQEVQLIQKMVNSGYEERMLLGLDTTRARMKSYGGEIGLSYISETFIPLLKKHGITDEVIKKFMIINPARALSIKK